MTYVYQVTAIETQTTLLQVIADRPLTTGEIQRRVQDGEFARDTVSIDERCIVAIEESKEAAHV